MNIKAKPFLKWVGGKSQLLQQLNLLLPHEFEKWSEVTYIELFVGGGAMLFFMLQRYPNIKHAVINDINPDLINCYIIVRDYPMRLIGALHQLEDEYLSQSTEDSRKDFYLKMRETYNHKDLTNIENATLLIFLNKTCFNGLYRVNKSGMFNVPFGRYEHPVICNEEIILADSALLKNVDILNGDFEKTFSYAQNNTFFYFDPPYRPLSVTSNFKDYSRESFDDSSQIRLKEFCDRIESAGYKFMLSNSDGKSKDSSDDFMDSLYEGYKINRVWASRSINADPSKRGKLSEIVVRNYKETRGDFVFNQQSELPIASEDTLKYGKEF